MRAWAISSVAVALAIRVLACSSASSVDTTGAGGSVSAGQGGAGGTAASSATASANASSSTGMMGPMCPYTGPPLVDPKVFPACMPACDGAHCVPAAAVPMADQALLAPCPNGFCVPDPIIASEGKGLPKTCASVAGAEGRCVSICLPAIAAEAALLPKDVCADDERCAPCFNPVAADPQKPTGACGLACDKPQKPPLMLTCPWMGPPVIDPASLPDCDGGGCAGAHCLPSAVVPPAEQAQLAPCGNGSGFCTPDEIIASGGQLIAASCDPFPGTGAPGRCLSACVPAVSMQAASLVQSTCDAGQLCVPCNNPFTGADTGACKLGCDTPPAQPFTFPSCCDDGNGNLTGTCVPSAQVPADQQKNLDQQGNGNSAPCPDSAAKYLCVPDEYLPAPYNKPPLQFCQATLFNFCGTCVSQCIVNGQLDILGPDDCAAHHKCVPCGAAPSTPGCSDFCGNGAVCGNSCNGDGDCGGACPKCIAGNCDTN